jgi:hypothetical protein
MSQNSKRLWFDPKPKLRVCLNFLAHKISTYFVVFGSSYGFSSTMFAVIWVHPCLKVVSERLTVTTMLLTWDFHCYINKVLSRSFQRKSVTIYAYEYLYTGYLMNVKRLHGLQSSEARKPPVIIGSWFKGTLPDGPIEYLVTCNMSQIGTAVNRAIFMLTIQCCVVESEVFYSFTKAD